MIGNQPKTWENSESADVLSTRAAPLTTSAREGGAPSMADSQYTRPGKGHWQGKKLSEAHVEAVRLGRRNGRTEEEHFWHRVDRRGPDECWPWKAGKIPKGYGVLVYQQRHRLATQVSWELTHGKPFPADMMCLHSCDNPPCVNPAHLRPGTKRDNRLDVKERGHHYVPRARSQDQIAHCKNGHRFESGSYRVRPDGYRNCIVCERDRRRKRGVAPRLTPTAPYLRLTSPEAVEAERTRIIAALEQACGVQANAAPILGVPFKKLSWRIKRLGIDWKQYRAPRG
jgi:hypothetical protein